MTVSKDEFLSGLANLIQASKTAATGFGLVILPAEGIPTVEQCDTIDALVSRLSELLQQGSQVVAFHGTPLKIRGRGDFRQLEFGGEIYPLSSTEGGDDSYFLLPLQSFNLGIAEEVVKADDEYKNMDDEEVEGDTEEE